MNNIALSEQIKRLRISKKMTLSVMAERIGATVSSISAYENGTRTPSLDVLVKIAMLFNVSIDYLMGFSSKNVVDISELNIRQTGVIHEIINLYKMQNKKIKEIIDSEKNISLNINAFGDMNIIDVEEFIRDNHEKH